MALPENIERELKAETDTLAKRVARVEAMPITQGMAAEAKELVDEIKAKLDGRHRVLDPFVEIPYRAHKEAVKKRAEHTNPLEGFWTRMRKRIADWDTERLRRIEMERRRKEEEQRRAQEAERAAEVKRLEEEAAARAAEAKQLEEKGLADAAAARVEEAKELTVQAGEVATAEIIPVVVEVDENKGRIAGTSSIARRIGEVEDMALFLGFIKDNPALWRLRGAGEPPCPPGELNRFLNANRGLTIPGVKISEDLGIRTRSA